MTTSELCEQIAGRLGTSVYSSKIEQYEIAGDNFFSMDDDDEWSFFFSTVGIKTYKQMAALRKWVAEWKDMKTSAMLTARKEPLPPSVSGGKSNTMATEHDPEWMRLDAMGKHCDTLRRGISALQPLSDKEVPVSMTLEDSGNTSDTHRRETSPVDYGSTGDKSTLVSGSKRMAIEKEVRHSLLCACYA